MLIGPTGLVRTINTSESPQIATQTQSGLEKPFIPVYIFCEMLVLRAFHKK